jgi:hypothetical protein
MAGGLINNSTVSGRIEGWSYVGGLVGGCFGDIINSHTDVTVSGGMYVGGLVGGLAGTEENEVEVSDSSSAGEVSGSQEEVGGLIGGTNPYSTVENSFSTAEVGGSWTVGGLIGTAEGNIISSYATGDVSSQGGYGVGGLVGFLNTGRIDYSYAWGRIEGYKANDPNNGDLETSYVGGLVGLVDDGYVYESYATGDVSAYSSRVGGLIGGTNSGVTNCYATGDVTAGDPDNMFSGGDKVGGLVGGLSGMVTNSYSTGVVTGSGTLNGGLVGFEIGASINSSYWDKETSGFQTSSGGTAASTTDMKLQGTFTGWDFSDIWSITENNYPQLKRVVTVDQSLFADGSGSESDPWQIETCQQLQAIDSNTNYLDDYYILKNDIDCSMTNPDDENFDDDTWSSEGFDPIGRCNYGEGCDYSEYFIGSLDGNGYKISGLYINRHGERFNADAALFAAIGDGEADYEVMDLGLEDVYIGGDNYSAGLVGVLNEGASVNRVYVTGEVNSLESAGGFAGKNYGNIYQSFADVRVSSPNEGAGGFVDNNRGYISDCYSTGNVRGKYYLGGFASENTGQILNSYSTGDVLGIDEQESNYLGGFIGYDQSESNNVQYSFSTGELSTYNGEVEYMAGFIGYSYGGDYTNNKWFNNLEVGVSGDDEIPDQPVKAESVSYFKGNEENAPLDSWNFDEIWVVATGTYPILRGISTNDSEDDEDTTYTLAYTAGTGGNVTGSTTQSVVSGENGTAVTAVANSGYRFVRWSDNSITNPRTDTNVSGNITVSAVFERISSGGSTSGSIARPIIATTTTSVSTSSIPVTNAGISSCEFVDLLLNIKVITSDKAVQARKILCETAPSVSTGTSTAYYFPRNLKLGMTGDDVKELQKFLNTHGFVLAQGGDGSAGFETTIFGSLTKNAVTRFQEANFEAILKPLNLTKGTGLFYDSTRTFVNNLLK